MTGKIYNLVVDLGRESSRFLSSEIRVLHPVTWRIVHLTRGCPSADITLEEGAIMRGHTMKRYVPGAAWGEVLRIHVWDCPACAFGEVLQKALPVMALK